MGGIPQLQDQLKNKTKFQDLSCCVYYILYTIYIHCMYIICIQYSFFMPPNCSRKNAKGLGSGPDGFVQLLGT